MSKRFFTLAFLLSFCFFLTDCKKQKISLNKLNQYYRKIPEITGITADRDRNVIFQCKFYIGYDYGSLFTLRAIIAYKEKIRGEIRSFLSLKTVDYLNHFENEEEIKKEIKEIINNIIKDYTKGKTGNKYKVEVTNIIINKLLTYSSS